MDKLEEILASKRKLLEHITRPIKAKELEILGQSKSPSIPFIEALSSPERLSIIAEIKRKSPSAGNIAKGMDAVEQARLYNNAAADALSILTDTEYFGGSLTDLWDVVDFLHQHQRTTPCLRKDFMIHPIQVLEAAEAGADAHRDSDDAAKARGCVPALAQGLGCDVRRQGRRGSPHRRNE